MAAIKFYYRNRPAPPIAFLDHEGIEVPQFIPGQCMCKGCKSRLLDYIPYIEDAKCRDCGQYQNEELNLM